MAQEYNNLDTGLDISDSEILRVSIPQPLTEPFQTADRVAQGKFYLIGSSVRKCILGESEFPDDIDFIGSFNLDAVQDHFRNQVVRRWDQFRTIKILRGGNEIDFISDTNIRGALRRRDITMSLMCIDKDGIVYDPLNYMEDLKKRIIRIENAEQKIQAEPERVLRVLRFAASLGYEVEALTKQACITNAGLMNSVNTEYALNKLMSMDLATKERVFEIAGEFGILGLVNNLTSRMDHR